MQKVTAPDAILQLVEKFDRNRDAYHSGTYNESQLRHEFLGPFFETLGWDVENKQGYAPAYRDVIFEDSLKIGGETCTSGACCAAAHRISAVDLCHEQTILSHDPGSPGMSE